MTRPARLPATVVVLVLALAACGGDDEASAPDATTTSLSVDPALREYCDRADEALQATDDIDPGSVDSIVAGFADAATRLRAAADVAPPEIRAQLEKLADAGHELNLELALAAERVRSVDELQQVLERDVTPKIQERFGDLEAEADAVGQFTEERCGIRSDD